MSFINIKLITNATFAITASLILTTLAAAQQGRVLSRDIIPDDSQNSQTSPAPPNGHPADGDRHGQPAETYAVVPGTRFLVKLENDLNTKEVHKNQTIYVRTAEPLEAGSGNYLPSGALIVGHVSRVDSAGTTGRAKIWLTFDEIQTRFGKLPIVAEVASVPGDHSLKAGPLQEGVIEGRSSTQKDAAQAAAAGAAMGAVQGVKDKNKKAAAEGAAMARRSNCPKARSWNWSSSARCIWFESRVIPFPE
jgi:hypothetical protein